MEKCVGHSPKLQDTGICTIGWVHVRLKFKVKQLKICLFFFRPAAPALKNVTNHLILTCGWLWMQTINIPSTWKQKCPPTISTTGPLVLQVHSKSEHIPIHRRSKHLDALDNLWVFPSSWDTFKHCRLGSKHEHDMQTMNQNLKSLVTGTELATLRRVRLTGKSKSRGAWWSTQFLMDQFGTAKGCDIKVKNLPMSIIGQMFTRKSIEVHCQHWDAPQEGGSYSHATNSCTELHHSRRKITRKFINSHPPRVERLAEVKKIILALNQEVVKAVTAQGQLQIKDHDGYPTRLPLANSWPITMRCHPQHPSEERKRGTKKGIHSNQTEVSTFCWHRLTTGRDRAET